ncbi:hypothetical protein, partial [Streptacidiphilus pinicola]|uniref:hypothetical protein n=1 Tax=Streptacidiphilus pinicola TaxID=2219663 RepID=UPI0014037E5C
MVALVVAGDPVALRVLAELRGAQPELVLPRARTVGRAELLGARLDLACLRIAERLCAQVPPVQSAAVASGPRSPIAGDSARGLGILWWRSVPRQDAAPTVSPGVRAGGREWGHGPGA